MRTILGAFFMGPKSCAPFSWLGSKSNMADLIMPHIPVHTNYVEPFFGSGAVFFKKPRSVMETINDLNQHIYNFFLCMRDKYDELQHQIHWTAYCRKTYDEAMNIYKNPNEFSDIKRAWAFFVVLNQGFGGKIGTWGTRLSNHKNEHNPFKFVDIFNALRNRLDKVQIENRDALDVIANYGKTANTFIYCDPPYINTTQGQYSGYTEADYQNLLDLLLTLPCKFMLSSYPNEPLNTMIADNPQLVVISKNQCSSVSKTIASKNETRTYRTELIIMNYDHKPKLF